MTAVVAQALRLFKRPQAVEWPLVALFLLMPFYLVIGWDYAPFQATHVPSTFLDDWFPLAPAWSVVYGSLFLAALLPAFVLHEPLLFRRTILAYLVAWLVAYAFFLAYPTLCPRPVRLEGDGFNVWLLRVIYGSDHRYNCFPSLHVAQCFIAAMACRVVHKPMGDVLLAWAALVMVSTLYTKQHYAADAIAGAALAFAAAAWMLRGVQPESIPPTLQQLAPALAIAAFGVYASFVTILWFIYVFT